jgi:hypothetical protein
MDEKSAIKQATNIQRIINDTGLMLTDRDKRCTDRYAVDAEGETVLAIDPGAVRFCLVGCLEYYIAKHGGSEAYHSDNHPLKKVLGRHLGVRHGLISGGLCVLWDDSSEEEQDKIARKMVEYVADPAEA